METVYVHVRINADIEIPKELDDRLRKDESAAFNELESLIMANRTTLTNVEIDDIEGE